MYFRRKMHIVSIILILILTVSYVLVDLRLKASILELAQSKAQLRVIEIINQAVNEKVVHETEYKDIVYVHKDDDGRIVMIQANTVILNQIMSKTITAVIEGLNMLEEEKVTVPLGQITGIMFLSGSGPKIEVRIIPSKQLSVAVKDRFEQAGINQTRHQIYLKIDSRIKIAVPFMAKEINVSTTVPMAETIIVGEVPETYVNFTGTGESLYPLIKK